MNKRQLGKTNIDLTAIGFGGAPLGNLFESLDERICYDILEKTEKSATFFVVGWMYDAWSSRRTQDHYTRL